MIFCTSPRQPELGYSGLRSRNTPICNANGTGLKLFLLENKTGEKLMQLGLGISAVRAASNAGASLIGRVSRLPWTVFTQFGDATSLYEKRSGGDQVSASSPVGVALNKAGWANLTAEQHMNAQPQLATNGGFDTDLTGWDLITGGQTVEWSAGALRMASDGTYCEAKQSGLLTVGNYYAMDFDVNMTVGALTLSIGNGDSPNFTTGHHRFIDRAGWQSLIVKRAYGSPCDGTIDNLSVKALPNNHFVASASNARPLLKTDGPRNYLDFDGTNDAMVMPFEGGAGPSSGSVFITSRIVDSDFKLFSTSDTTKYLGSGLLGSADTVLSVGAGSPVFKDGETTLITRGQICDALGVGGPKTIEITNVDFSSWSELGISATAASALAGDIFSVMVLPTSEVTPAIRADILAFLSQ